MYNVLFNLAFRGRSNGKSVTWSVIWLLKCLHYTYRSIKSSICLFEDGHGCYLTPMRFLCRTGKRGAGGW